MDLSCLPDDLAVLVLQLCTCAAWVSLDATCHRMKQLLQVPGDGVVGFCRLLVRIPRLSCAEACPKWHAKMNGSAVLHVGFLVWSSLRRVAWREPHGAKTVRQY